jgi:hypothetical protein
MIDRDTYTNMEDPEFLQGTSYFGSHFKASEKELKELFNSWPVSNDPRIGWALLGEGAHIGVYLHNCSDIEPARSWVIDWHVGGRNSGETEKFSEWINAQLEILRSSANV